MQENVDLVVYLRVMISTPEVNGQKTLTKAET